MPKVPDSPKPFVNSHQVQSTYCFRPNATKADMQHDIEQVNKFIDHVLAKKRNRTKPVQKD